MGKPVKIDKRLFLDRKRISRLDDEAMRQVYGGAATASNGCAQTYTCCCTSCPSCGCTFSCPRAN